MPVQELTADRFRDVMARWPTGVSVVTALHGGAPAGCTVNALMSLSMEPPLLLVSFGETSSTLAAIREAGAFAVNILGWDQRELCQRFARGDHAERFRGVVVGMRHGVPVLDQAASSIVCEVAGIVPCADHALVLGAPRWHASDASRLPLVLHDRAPRRLGG